MPATVQAPILFADGNKPPKRPSPTSSNTSLDASPVAVLVPLVLIILLPKFVSDSSNILPNLPPKPCNALPNTSWFVAYINGTFHQKVLCADSAALCWACAISSGVKSLPFSFCNILTALLNCSL